MVLTPSTRQVCRWKQLQVIDQHSRTAATMGKCHLAVTLHGLGYGRSYLLLGPPPSRNSEGVLSTAMPLHATPLVVVTRPLCGPWFANHAAMVEPLSEWLLCLGRRRDQLPVEATTRCRRTQRMTLQQLVLLGVRRPGAPQAQPEQASLHEEAVTFS